MNKKYLFSLAVLTAMVAISTSAFAEDGRGEDGPRPYMMGTSTGMRKDAKGLVMARPEVVGKVLTISGTTLTVTGKAAEKGAATTTYTVDASNAVILKGNATTTIGEIVVGDLVVVQGTRSGTNVTAKLVRDAMIRNPKAATKPGAQKAGFTGTGEPVIGGVVSSVSGTTIVLAPLNASSTSYTVNTANAKIIVKGKQASTTTDIMVGDHVIVQGVINGTSVTASSIIDQNKPGDNEHKNGDKNDKEGTGKGNEGGNKQGFFGGIGGFFKHLFGF